MTTDDDKALALLRTRRDAIDAAITQIEAEQAAAERTVREADQHQQDRDYIRNRWQRVCQEDRTD